MMIWKEADMLHNIGLGVLLLDDVFTTGSTLKAATEALLDGGASSVSVLTIARDL